MMQSMLKVRSALKAGHADICCTVARQLTVRHQAVPGLSIAAQSGPCWGLQLAVLWSCPGFLPAADIL